MNGRELHCSACGKVLESMGLALLESGDAQAWEGGICTNCRLIWCDDCRPPGRPPVCPKCKQRLKPSAECYLWESAFSETAEIDKEIRLDAEQRKARRLDKVRFEAFREALTEMDADTIRTKLNPSVNELVALAYTLTGNDWYYNEILEVLLTLLERTGDSSVAKAIPHIARAFRPYHAKPHPTTGLVTSYYEPSGVRLAQAVMRLGRPSDIIDELLRLSTAQETHWCNQLMIIACLAELGEQQVLPIIDNKLGESSPDEPLLGWVSNLLTRARAKVSPDSEPPSFWAITNGTPSLVSLDKKKPKKKSTKLASPDRPAHSGSPKRPGCVTAYAVFLVIAFAVTALGGIIEAGGHISAIFTASVLAVLCFLLVRGLWRLRNWARIIVIVLQSLMLLSGLRLVYGTLRSYSYISDPIPYVTGQFVAAAVVGYVLYWFASRREYFD